jgi:hypothetical protein
VDREALPRRTGGWVTDLLGGLRSIGLEILVVLVLVAFSLAVGWIVALVV